MPTILDISHQIEALDLLTNLDQARGTTIVMALHDLNLAARYADYLVAITAGRLYVSGPPEEVLTDRMCARIFNPESRVIVDPTLGQPNMLPISRNRMNGNISG